MASIARSETVEAAEVMKAETLTRPWPSLPCRCPLLQEDHSQKSHHHGLGSGLAGKSLDQSHLLFPSCFPFRPLGSSSARPLTSSVLFLLLASPDSDCTTEQLPSPRDTRYFLGTRYPQEARKRTAGKVSSSGAQFLHPRAGPPGAANAALSGRLCPGSPAAAAPAAATAKAGLRPVPPPRAAHTGASLAARIPALARVPEGIFLARARARAAPPARSPPRAAAAPGTRRGAARELGARAQRFRGPGPQLLPRAPVPGGCAWAHRDWVEMGDSLCNLFKTGVVTKRPLLTAF